MCRRSLSWEAQGRWGSLSLVWLYGQAPHIAAEIARQGLDVILVDMDIREAKSAIFDILGTYARTHKMGLESDINVGCVGCS